MGTGIRRRALLVVALGLLLSAWLAPPARAEDAPPAADAYHLRDWADGRHDALYTEWWYFNVRDAAQDVQAIFSYFIADPGNLTRHGLAQIAAVAYTPAGRVSAVDAYPPDAFSASYAAADVRIESGAIEVIGADTYRIAGASRSMSRGSDAASL